MHATISHPLRLLLATAAAALILTAAGRADAYSVSTIGFNKVKWGSSTVTLHMVDRTLSASDMDAIRAAAAAWNRVGADATILTVTDTEKSGAAYPNGDSEIARSPGNSFLGNSPAYTVVWLDPFTAHISESDIWINDYYPVPIAHITNKADHQRYGGDTRALAPLMTHELGHALGLGHENRFYNVMGSDTTFVHANGDSIRPYVGADATAGAANLYGWDAEQDLSVTHWRYAGTSGPYSTHTRTRMFDASTGAVLAKTIVADEPVYDVRRGRGVLVELTYENAGFIPLTQAAVTLYLSTDDDTIETTDRPLASYLVPIRNGLPSTITIPVTIPTDAPLGQQALGARIAISDTSSSNNATYIHVDIAP